MPRKLTEAFNTAAWEQNQAAITAEIKRRVSVSNCEVGSLAHRTLVNNAIAFATKATEEFFNSKAWSRRSTDTKQ